MATATGAAGNSTALVGTPETVAQALLDYVDIGVTTMLIRGSGPAGSGPPGPSALGPAGRPGRLDG